MIKFKIPIITSGPCGLNFKEWVFTMTLVQIIPFSIAVGKAYHIYFSSSASEGQNISLAIAIFCTIHLQFIIIQVIGIVTKFLPLLYFWLVVGAFESVCFTVLVMYAGSVAVINGGYSYGIILIICGPLFAVFLLYCVVTVNSFIFRTKEIERLHRILIEQGNENRTEIYVY